MTKMFICSFILILLLMSSLFLYSHTPLAMGVLIVFQSVIIALMLYIFMPSSWFSFLLIMVFLSGMMIIFMYVSSLAANELTSFSLLFFVLPFFIILIIYLNNNNYINQTTMNCLSMNLMELAPLNIYKVYSSEIYPMTLVLIIYLLVALIVVVKNSNFFKSFRSKK
uniref:NADH dehydrogenase subunit 6 n=1 Tax=Parhyale hawaiensis TaxID=317513 RepID=Q6DVI3_9CRUS|nr:NADH dehydrogenase subunit 6 [Parhyale hawaiensis]AAT69316.1 NADH dehydrogenase subunit 6 [Parhyale hawaiensis]AYB71611.1 NADH dehydrogenase subunit 6 [Parhyale hawaiensis]